jgi:hypothetical protein
MGHASFLLCPFPHLQRQPSNRLIAWRGYLREQERRQDREFVTTTEIYVRPPCRPRLFSCAPAAGRPFPWIDPMSFKYSYTFPISGPNKLPRFRQWAAQHTPEIEVSLPPQVPARSENMTIRLKSTDDRERLMEKLTGATL